MVPKLNHLVIFGISWLAEFNPQIDWRNHSVQLNLNDEEHTVIASHAADSFSGIDLCTVN